MQPELNTTASQATELLQLLDQLPPDRRQWFVDEIRRLDRGEPNVFEGTAPNPYAEGASDEG